MEEQREEYKKKILICEKLGANKFQEIVFKTENIKYKVIKTLFPNLPKYYDKICDYKRDKKLKKLHSDVSKKKVVDYYRTQKLLLRKELLREQNRNYHIDQNRPTEFIKYLEWNKSIHQKGLKKDTIIIAFLSLIAFTGIIDIIPIILLLAIELGSAFINFQCINIQNYNIYRFKDKEKTLQKLEEQKEKSDIDKYGQAAKVISESFNKTNDIPSIDDIINNIETKEQLTQLRNLALSTLDTNRIREKAKEKSKSATNKLN